VIGYDFWTGGGVTAKAFTEELSKITASTVHLFINSPGGDVFEARTMISAMARHPANFIAHVDGLAASAASSIAVAADDLEMAPGSMLMIHNAWTLAMGDKATMLDTAALLDKIDGTIAADYAKKAGVTQEVAAAWMNAETWFTADEAVASKLADRIVGEKVKAQAWNLSAYEHAPEPAAPEPSEYPTEHMNTLERRLSLFERAPA
jgi:ATP-dependent Clp protease protease subunit